MPTINIADKFTGEVLEQYAPAIGDNLLYWLKRHVPNFECREHPPISVAINGSITVQRCWDYRLRDGDVITIYPEPKDPGTIGTLILKAVIAYGVNYIANKLLAPKIDDNYNRTMPEGSSSIYSANAQGNAARLNGIIPEVFGQHPVYPDYLFPPWREYVDNEEYLNIGLSVGAGYYGLPSGFGSIRIGNTTLTNYTDFIDIALYDPSTSIVNNANRIMYQAPEVGGTSNESGLELKREKTVAASMPAGTLYEFVGDQIIAWLESESTASFGQFDSEGNYIGSADVTQKTYSQAVWTNYGFADNALIDIRGTGVYDGTYQIFEIYGNEISVTKNGVPASFSQTSKLQGSASLISSDEAGWFGWFSVTPPNTTAGGFWVDLLFRGGIGRLENNGSISPLTVTHELQWRRKSGDTSITIVMFSTTGSSFDDHATSQPVVVSPVGEIEVRMRRVTVTSNDSNVRGNALWQRVRCLLPTPMSYPATTLFLRIKGTDGLAANSENQVNLDVIRQLPVLYSGGNWAATRSSTRQISAAVGEVARGLGLLSKIDAVRLAALEQTWTARGDWFDAVLDNDSTMFEVLRRMLAVGYAEPTIADGKISFVRDAATTTFDGQMWSWDNIIKLSEDGTLFDPDEPDGVRVEYFDPATRKPASVDCLLPGDAGVLPEEVRAFGITDRTKAWRYGMRLRRARRYLRKQYTLETELEALNSHVGEICTLPSRRGQHGYLVAHNPADWEVTTNTALTWGSGTHYIRIRLPDGTGTFTAPVTRIDDYTVRFNINPLNGITLDFDSVADPPLFVFGALTEIYNVARLKNVSPSNGETVSVELVNYDARVYADDNNTAP